jgi:hypothetical protein
MADQKIVDYVKENLQKGVAIEDIKGSLRESGWPQEEVEKGLQEASGGSPAPPEAPAGTPGPKAPAQGGEKEKKKGHKKLILALIIMLILVFLVLYVAASIIDSFAEMYPDGMASINDILSNI